MGSKLEELYGQQKELSVKAEDLKKSMLEEQNDVERLEGHSLTAFIYAVIGKMDEKVDKEREEAFAAAVKYEVTASELTAVENDIQKHSYLDEAQNEVEQLQIQLRRLKTELTDIIIHTDIQVSINGFLGFADYFFDGFFADSAVLNKINQSQTQVENTKGQIKKILTHLTAMLHSANQELEHEKTKLDNLIVNAII